MPRPTERAGPAVSVLLVEDEPRLREVLVAGINELGHPAEGVRSGEEALARLAERNHDIVVVDLNLPGISGLECLEQIRELRPTTQAIVITGYGDLKAAQHAIHLDVVEFLTKPASLGELEHALHRAWQRIRAGGPQPPCGGARTPSEPPAGAEAGGRSLRDLERQEILAAVERHSGNRQAAAAELGISVRTLYYRLAEYQGRRTASAEPG
jgi:DNA-binding NtrC family response regulator